MLIVEPDAAYREVLERTASKHAVTESVGDFQTAYARLAEGGVDLLVTNLRLRVNVEGLQLAYVAATSGFRTRVVVYGRRFDDWIIRELQRAGAFYETQTRLQFALPSYVHAELPELDRRNPAMPDRRGSYRGGRRASDVPLIG
jgi:hypothetical protein